MQIILTCMHGKIRIACVRAYTFKLNNLSGQRDGEKHATQTRRGKIDYNLVRTSTKLFPKYRAN